MIISYSETDYLRHQDDSRYQWNEEGFALFFHLEKALTYLGKQKDLPEAGRSEEKTKLNERYGNRTWSSWTPISLSLQGKTGNTQ